MMMWGAGLHSFILCAPLSLREYSASRSLDAPLRAPLRASPRTAATMKPTTVTLWLIVCLFVSGNAVHTSAQGDGATPGRLPCTDCARGRTNSDGTIKKKKKKNRNKNLYGLAGLAGDASTLFSNFGTRLVSSTASANLARMLYPPMPQRANTRAMARGIQRDNAVRAMAEAHRVRAQSIANAASRTLSVDDTNATDDGGSTNDDRLHYMVDREGFCKNDGGADARLLPSQGMPGRMGRSPERSFASCAAPHHVAALTSEDTCECVPYVRFEMAFRGPETEGGADGDEGAIRDNNVQKRAAELAPAVAREVGAEADLVQFVGVHEGSGGSQRVAMRLLPQLTRVYRTRDTRGDPDAKASFDQQTLKRLQAFLSKGTLPGFGAFSHALAAPGVVCDTSPLSC